MADYKNSDKNNNLTNDLNFFDVSNSMFNVGNIIQSISELIFERTESDSDENHLMKISSNTSTPQTLSFSDQNHEPTMAAINKLFDINKIINNDYNNNKNNNNNNNNNNGFDQPYSTRSNPEILIFDVNSNESTPIDTLISNVTNIFTVNKPPMFNSQTSTTTASTTAILMDEQDDSIFYFGSTCLSSPEEYELFTSMLCSSFLVLGVVYFTYGYRCFRALAFFIGMIFGATLFYTVCTAENIHLVPTLVPNGNLIASLLTGMLIGLFTMLVAYIGLFVIGIHLGLLLAIGLLIVIYLLRPYYIVLQAPLSALTLLIFFVALSLVGALTTVYFSKGCTILASSMYGSALTLLCADYFIESFKVIHWFLDQLSNKNDWYGLLVNIKRDQTLCLGSYIILILWPVFTIFGIIIQSCFTAKYFEYREGYGIVNDGNGPTIINHQPFSRENIRSFHHPHHNNSNIRSNNLEESRLEQRHRKYRYLYQVRTAHGDVISQHYLQSLQNKKLCLPDQDSFTFNSDLSSHFFPSESRTTTLSVA